MPCVTCIVIHSIVSHTQNTTNPRKTQSLFKTFREQKKREKARRLSPEQSRGDPDFLFCFSFLPKIQSLSTIM